MYERGDIMAFDQLKYINDFNKDTYKMYQFRIKRSDSEIIEYLDNMTNRNAYLLSLVNEDIAKKEIYTIKKIKDTIKPILNKYGIYDINLFGSYARGEATKDSDVDIYCDKGNIKTLIDQVLLEEELKNALNKEVDIIFNTQILDDYFKKQIMKDLIKLY